MNQVTFACKCKHPGHNPDMVPATPHVSPSDSVALRWLSRQLAWEQTLAELRDPHLAERDEAAA